MDPQGNILDMGSQDILQDTFHPDSMGDMEKQDIQVGTACQAGRSNMVWEDIQEDMTLLDNM